MSTTQQITNEAINRVKENNRKDHDKILLFATDWIKKQFKPFSSENLKNDYYSSGNENPSEPRVFGAVFRALSHEGLIIKNGFELSKNPKCHSRPQQVWISKQYSDLQAHNRKSKSLEPNLFTVLAS